jgi:hypothetical protein
MYNDHSSKLREGWRFSYKGKELLPLAQEKLTEHREGEAEARNAVVSLLMDMTVSRTDPRIKEWEQKIVFHGNLGEQCAVWVHQFQREPDREFLLALGDVVYFDIVERALDV